MNISTIRIEKGIWSQDYITLKQSTTHASKTDPVNTVHFLSAQTFLCEFWSHIAVVGYVAKPPSKLTYSKINKKYYFN